MKRLVVSGLVLLPVLAFSQSRADVMIGSEAFKKAFQPKSNIQTKIERKVLQQEHKAKVEKAKKLTKEKCSDNKCTFKQVLKAIFLGGKFPWETEDQYRLRKQMECTPAGQPFK